MANTEPLLFPLPGDALGGRTVIASVTYRDDEITLVLLLNPGPPYFTVAHYFLVDVPAEGDIPARTQGEVTDLGFEYNIVPAVEQYKQWGGDY